MRLSQHHLVVLLAGFSIFIGCTSFLRRPEEKQEFAKVKLPQTVGEATRPHGLSRISIEGIGLVTGLRNTGSDPPPSPQRNALLDEMKRLQVERPQQLLADPTTSVAIVRAVLPPGLQKGDAIDIEVRAPARSKTGSLEAGWLMETKLREVAILNQSLHTGKVRGIAEGSILIDALLEDRDDEVAKQRGTILGGGVATKSRPLGLQLNSEHHSVSISKLIAAAVNRRFDTYVRGVKQGAAKPKTNEFIELVIHPRYRHNLIRYLRVIEQIKLRESIPEQVARLEQIKNELLVPSRSALAALKLEAIGDEATSVLLAGLGAESAEVRFYSAEALAYLDVAQAASQLAAAADESAFRSRALLALGAMSSVEAHDALTNLLHVPSAETRYGAFRALQNMNPRDPQLGQEILGERLFLHEIASDGEPMVHVARSRRQEIVVFGADQPITPPLVYVSGRKLMVKATADEVRVTKYSLGREDEVMVARPTVGGLVRTMVRADASYPEIIEALHQAKRQDALQSRLEFDAIPSTGRTYQRPEEEAAEPAPEEEPE